MKHSTAARRGLLPETTSMRKALWKASVAGSAVLVVTVGPGLLPQLASAVTAEPGGTASISCMAGLAGM